MINCSKGDVMGNYQAQIRKTIRKDAVLMLILSSDFYIVISPVEDDYKKS